MQRRLKIYLENSLISMYFQDDAPYLRDLTRQFWEETLPHFEAYVSDIVLAEIRAIEDNNLINLSKPFLRLLSSIALISARTISETYASKWGKVSSQNCLVKSLR